MSKLHPTELHHTELHHTELHHTELHHTELHNTELCPMNLPNNIWRRISMSSPSTYFKLLQVSRILKQDTDFMKAHFITKYKWHNITTCRKLPNGWLHSCDDQPAAIHATGDMFWYFDGRKHRDNGLPAELWVNGTQCWYIDNKLHRDDNQPAKIRVDGHKYWYVNGKRYYDNDRRTKAYNW